MKVGIKTREVLTCVLCGTTGAVNYHDLRDRFFSVPGQWELMRCPQCGLVWLNPQPISAEIGKLYESYFTHEIVGEARFAWLRRSLRDAVLTARLGYDRGPNGVLPKLVGRIAFAVRPIRDAVVLGVMTLRGPGRGKLLDVGCGNGQFLAKMRDLGWEVAGVELDPKAVRIARERLELNIYEGSLEEASFATDTFDAVTMNHVLEHVLDPVNTLRECWRVLKPRGKLIVTTPNLKSLGHRVFGCAWPHLDPPRHLHLFSKQTLKESTENVGLRPLKLWTSGRQASWTWVAGRLIQRRGGMPGGSLAEVNWWLRLEGIVFRVVENELCAVIDVGEDLVMEAAK